MLRSLLLSVGLPLLVLAVAPKGPWDSFNYAPASKTVWPVAIHSSNGTVQNADNLVQNVGSATLTGEGSWVALDFGVEVGGLISLDFLEPASSAAISLSFTESPLFISPTTSDDSTLPVSSEDYDGVMRVSPPLPSGHWTQPAYALRGGFRYLTIVSSSPQSITISNISCAISFMPHVDDLREYQGYFYATDPVYSDKDFLTKVWYAGAYTVQTNTVPVDTGRVVPFVPSPGWANNATIGVAGPILVDGAKRDRAVWPGDMGIAVPTQFVSTNDLLPAKNSLSTIFVATDPNTGALPESGPPLNALGSDTYQAWTLIGVHNYYIYSGDIDWLKNVWHNYTLAVSFLENKVDDTGLMDVTGTGDWARLDRGGHDSEGNALLYKVLTGSVDLAMYVNDTILSAAWAKNASNLKDKFNAAFWDASQGMYTDNTTTTLAPQDGNSLAVLFNLTISPMQAVSISKGLRKNWNELGAVSPEVPNTISPFISSFEVQAHFEAFQDDVAMDLLRREWGYLLYTNLSVQSTFLEGFNADGSLGYRASVGYNEDPTFVSHSHGWSTGPTSALTFYVLGLRVTSPQGQTWSVAPHLSGLPLAEGSFTSPLGWYGVQWSVDGTYFNLNITVPTGTSGELVWPVSGQAKLNDKRTVVDVEKGQKMQLTGGAHSYLVTIA